MKKKTKLPNLKSWLIPRLRRVYMAWPAKKEAWAKTRQYIPIGFYKNGKIKTKSMNFCEVCGVFHDPKEMQLDHINPVINPETGGYIQGTDVVNWNEILPTLFCDSSNLQTICTPCHDHKSLAEDSKRKK